MNLDEARTAVINTLSRMDAAYSAVVFDEWVLVSLKPDRGSILSYHGPRGDSFKKSFNADIQPLRAEISGQKLAIGDFAFAQAAKGQQHDACMRVGDTSYLFCNHTAKTIADIREQPLWREAQKAWVQLSELFRTDPVR